jgi:hypothetical protein
VNEQVTPGEPVTRGSSRAHSGSLSINAFGRQPNTFSISANFIDSGSASQWTETRYGDCALRSNFSATTNLDLYASAGLLRVTSEPGGIDLSASPKASTGSVEPIYEVMLGAKALSGGEVLTISAEGGTVPAFEATIVVPRALRLTTPAPDASGLIHADGSKDLRLTFVPTAEPVRLELGVTGAGGWLGCSVLGSSGELLVPASAIDAVSPTATATLFARQTGAMNAGDWPVDIATRVEVVGTGAAAQGITFE